MDKKGKIDLKKYKLKVNIFYQSWCISKVSFCPKPTRPDQATTSITTIWCQVTSYNNRSFIKCQKTTYCIFHCLTTPRKAQRKGSGRIPIRKVFLALFRFHRITLPTSCWTAIGIMAPLYLGLVSKRAFFRNPVSAPLQWLAVSAFFGAITNSVVWRCCEAAMMEKSPTLLKIVKINENFRLRSTTSAFTTSPLPRSNRTSRGFCKSWTHIMKPSTKNDQFIRKIKFFSFHSFNISSS